LCFGHFKCYANRAFHGARKSHMLFLFSILKKGAAIPPTSEGIGFRAVV